MKFLSILFFKVPVPIYSQYRALQHLQSSDPKRLSSASEHCQLNGQIDYIWDRQSHYKMLCFVKIRLHFFLPLQPSFPEHTIQNYAIKAETVFCKSCCSSGHSALHSPVSQRGRCQKKGFFS